MKMLLGPLIAAGVGIALMAWALAVQRAPTDRPEEQAPRASTSAPCLFRMAKTFVCLKYR